MKICMIVEGSYPYLTGGLSAWVQMMITGMPEHQFIIFSIGAEEKDKGRFKYEIPINVLEVREVFLDSILKLNNPDGGRYRLKPLEKENLAALICGEGEINLEVLVEIFRSGRGKNALDIFMSFDFFDVITDAYKKKFNQLPFTEFFWTVRSMLLPLFFLVQQELPEADVYHSVATGYAGAVASLAATVYRKPVVLTEHGIYSREREEEIIKSNWVKAEFKDLWITYFHSLSKLTYQKSTQVFTMFEKNAEIQAFLGCDPAKMGIIPNGIDVEKYSTVQAEQDEIFITIGTVARVVPIKDIITMLRGFSLVKERLPNARFYIIGPTDENKEYYGECLKVVQNLGLTDIEFTGAVNVRSYLGRMDIMVLSSISEGQPLVMLEGMAARKPYVSTDVGSCRELLFGAGDEFGQAGIVVPVMDYEGLAEAVVFLARDKNLRDKMGESGYQRVSALYTQSGFIDKYKELYMELG